MALATVTGLSIAKAVGPSAATFAVNVAFRKTTMWIRAKNMDIDELYDDDEKDEIKKQLTQSESDKIHSRLDIMETSSLEAAYIFWEDACKWNRDIENYKNDIQSAYNECRKALVKITKPLDRIRLYSLYIATGFIYRSNYGTDYIEGLKHIYDALVTMNNTNKKNKLNKVLITELRSALKSKPKYCSETWSKKHRKLIKSVVHFAVKTNAFIQEIQNNHAHQEEQKYNSHGEVDTTLQHQMMIYTAINNQKGSSLASTSDVLKNDWYPTYFNGYYFGNVTQTPLFNPLTITDFREVMGVVNIKDPYIEIDGIVIYTISIFDACTHLMKYNDSKQCYHCGYNGLINPFKIKIKTEDGNPECMYTISDVRVGDINKELLRRKKNGACMINNVEWLQYNGIKLSSKGTTLREYNIQEGSTLTYRTKESWSCMLPSCLFPTKINQLS